MAEQKRKVFVTGSGLVWIPQDRANEISTVIAEHHRLEAERIQNALIVRRTVIP